MRNRKGIIWAMALVAVVSLFFGEEVKADNGWDIPLNGPSTTTSQSIASASISIGGGTVVGTLDAANASTNPDEAGKVLSQTATITVGNTDGYTVAVSGSANLTGRNSSSHVLKAVSGSKTLGSMSDEWGYYAVLGDSEASFVPSNTFKAMSTSTQTVGTGAATSSIATKKVTLFYGARVTSATPEDYYGGSVTVSVVAQPRTVTTTASKFNGITTMQAMTSTICSNAAVNDTALLTDTRDNKKYWVTKLLDGNCWMSQNLDLDITTTNIATATSDVTANWTASSTYPAKATTTSLATGSATATDTYSWDVGQYVINAPTGMTSCGDNATGLSGCSMFTAVGSRTASTDPNFYRKSTYTGTDGATSCTKTANTSVSTATSGVCAQYDAHYLVGNYYQWNAATAGTGGTISNYATATGSICPKGWKLPGSATNASTITKGTYAYLLQQYGLATAYNSGPITGTSAVNGNTYDIALSPLFGVRGGYVGSGTTPIQSAGAYGRYWSSRAWSGPNNAYSLNFYTSVNPSSGNARYAGFSLRCFVQTSYAISRDGKSNRNA